MLPPGRWIKDDIYRFIPDRKDDLLPMTGFALWRWRAACDIRRFGCWVGGRHAITRHYDASWKDIYCPYYGKIEDSE